MPEAVLQRAQAELLDWQGKGLSIMEMSHRSDEFVSVGIMSAAVHAVGASCALFGPAGVS